ncbi:multidrug ABC transporter permease [Cellulomonas sp. zg-ZUI222]|uniref:Multidrug ABC transporter permease n=1 Tax=Cellulomonas wangleii TaxID=2816956 RepID=A0ABX8D805_9CELL|nr:multidrug ABC transporter permease [Cellulomonas wangleii]MBO0922179.1 multidrug ABC transporter permease [Cellulomonas wangleii]MBO0926100.1 multidrug ABC transporter permease [Cellulomonas wangleii]QVI62621.1 multidrug ABC transporter permease [Cellulomonas wangleii]
MSTATASLTGTRPLLRAALRHDGRLFAPWVLVVTLLSASSVIVYPWVFPDLAARLGLAAAVEANPAIGLIFGPAYDLTTVDGFNSWRTLALGGFFVALGAILTVTRTTRGQEDSGQAELLASGVVGRSARLLTGVAVATVGSFAAGLVAGVVTALCGGAWEASLLLGATYTASGWMFAAVAAVAAQIGSDARTANALAVGTLGALFLARGFCLALDAPAWTVWANPLGWTLETRPAAGDHWAPLLLTVAFTLVVVTVGFALQARRDFGQGSIAQRPGPARGRVRGPLLLALRLNRAPIVTWAIAFHLLGLVFGYFTTSITDLVSGSTGVQQVLASGATTPEQLTGAFVRTLLSLVGIIAAVPGIQIVLRVRSEELEDRVEPVLAGALPRVRYYAAHVAVALTVITGYLVGAGIVVGLMAARADLPVGLVDVVLQTLATVPAVWTVVAVSVAVVGARPVVHLAAWGALVASFLLTLLGPTFGLDDWVLGISPFWHVPDTTAAAPDWSGLGWLTLVTAGLVAVGFAGFRRRDVGR